MNLFAMLFRRVQKESDELLHTRTFVSHVPIFSLVSFDKLFSRQNVFINGKYIRRTLKQITYFLMRF